MTNSLKTVTTRNATATPQSQKAAKGQKRNNAGGYTFTVSDLDRAKRFLILGAETNFYTPGEKLAAQNAKTIIKLATASKKSSNELVDLIVEISTEGRAAKQDAGLFALAIAASHGDDKAKGYALSKIGEVARTGRTLFVFLGYVEQFRGWGPALRRAVANWYLEKSVDQAAFQTVKYRSQNIGTSDDKNALTHRDVFRLSHPKSEDEAFQGLGEWILRGDASKAPEIVKGFVAAQQSGADIPALIREYRLSWEMVPTEALNDVKTWEALSEVNLPYGALIRQLPRLTRIGFLKPMSKESKKIAAILSDPQAIQKARIHPIAILTALKTYSSGRSLQGSGTWTPLKEITNALDAAFPLAFKNVEPANKRTLIGLDVSGSMGWGGLGAAGGLTPREITAAIATVIEGTEPSTHIIGFTGYASGSWGRRTAGEKLDYVGAVKNLDNIVTSKRRLDDVVSGISRLPMGPTDCSLPMMYALEKGLEVDTFIVMTDNDTWSGEIHAHEALKLYRKKTGIDAKLIVLATTASKFTIADPKDAGMIDIAGFDSAVPQLVSNFSRGL